MYSLFSLVLVAFLLNTASCARIHHQFIKTSLPSTKTDLVCTIGPTFWCFNHTTAQKCDAEEYCVENVWNKIPPRDDETMENHQISSQSQSASVCNQVVTSLRDVLIDNYDKNDIKQVFREICKKTTSKTTTAICVNLVNENFDVIHLILSNELLPAKLCLRAGQFNLEHKDD